MLLHGAPPRDVVRPPTWEETLVALGHELAHVEGGLPKVSTEPFAPFAVLNCCRIAHTLATRDSAVSKRESARWALASLPREWRAPVQAAVRWYDRGERPGDDRLLQERCAPLAAYVRQLLPT